MAHGEERDGRDGKVEINPRDVPFWVSTRLGLAIIGFLGFVNVYAVRVNLSVAIVCMVNHTALDTADTNNNSHDSSVSECRAGGSGENDTDTELNPLGGALLWDKSTQGFILGSFFWGYLISQVPAGWCATKFGGKWVFGSTMLIASVLTVLTPALSELHYAAAVVVRILLGVVTGMTFPSMHAMWGKWAPPTERTKLMTFTYAGAQVGIVVTFPLSGMLCKYGFAGGWPSVFYVTGGASFLWSVAWILLVSDSPATHKRITPIERDYILTSLKTNAREEETKKTIKVPWLSIFTSLPVWAIIIANIMSDWGAYTLLTNIPTYINEVLQFDITSNGLVSALPYIAFWLVINIGGWLADFLRERNIMSTERTRKALNTCGQVIPALMLVGLGYVDCSESVMAVILLVLAVSISGFQYSGFLVNHVDIAPQLAGILFGLTNSIASVTGFISPVIVGIITEERQTRAEWQKVFYIAAAMYIIGAVVFAIFAKGDVQKWAVEEPKRNNSLELRTGSWEEKDKMVV